MSYTELKRKTVVCKKVHYCQWCGQRIEISEKADYRSYIFEGDFGSGYMHIECLENGFNREDNETLACGFEIGSYKRGSLEIR